MECSGQVVLFIDICHGHGELYLLPVLIIEFVDFIYLQQNFFFQFAGGNGVLKKLTFKSSCLINNLKMKKDLVFPTESFSDKTRL